MFLLHPADEHKYDGLIEEIIEFQFNFGPENTGSNLALIPAGETVITRYRTLPFGKELEAEILALGSKPINTYREHRNIATISTWVPLLDELTPPVYEQWQIPYLGEGEWFVKGETNSIKNRWYECCYAPTTKDLPVIVRNNQLDMYVGSQTIYIRPYQHYRQIGEAVDGRPVYHEKRAFIHNGQILTIGNYWSNLVENPPAPLNEANMWATLNEAVARTKDLASYYVIDIAEYPDGTWGVVELNDGCMSGLSGNDPAKLYWNMERGIQS